MKSICSKPLLVLAAALCIGGCTSKDQDNEPFEAVATTIRVTEKGRSDDFAKNWIVGSNVNTDTIGPIRIEVENEMVWNLIEPNREYFVNYQGSVQQGYVLEQIERIGDDSDGK